MGMSMEAKLFYGYLQPTDDRERYLEMDSNEEDTSWSAIHTKEANGCVGGMYGYDENLGFFLAVKESLHEAEWDEVVQLSQRDFIVQPLWNDKLVLAATTFGLDPFDVEAGWYLVSLYF